MEDLGKGICRLSVVPVRKEPADQSEIVTQLLFGDHYIITDTHKSQKWLKIQIFFDNYPGWIDCKQHTPISEEYFEEINRKNLKITIDPVNEASFGNRSLMLVAGSILPESDNELFHFENFQYKGESKSLGDKKGFDFIKKCAFRYLDMPYLWGGKTPFGIDCSGLTQVVFRLGGYSLLRDTRQQYSQGEAVESIADSLPGDLAFFKNEKDLIVHVGIILENSDIIHASGQVRIDKLDELGIFRKDFNTYTHTLAGIRRLLR